MRGARSLHEIAPVHPLGGALIVGTAEQTDPVGIVEMRPRKAVQVIEFEPAFLLAPAAPRSSVKVQRPESRSNTSRWMALGMWREPETGSAAVRRGLRTSPNRSFVTRSMSASSAFSTIVPTSPSGTRWRSRSCAWRSLSRQARLAVNWNLKVSSARGLITARRSSLRGTGAEVGAGPDSVAPDESCDTAVPADSNKVRGGFSGVACAGTLRMTVGTGGFGARRATSSSIWRVDLPVASANTAATFSAVRCGARSRKPVRCTRPERSASRMAGRRRAARATAIR